MIERCKAFRAELSERLSGKSHEAPDLFWHKHLLACTSCRSLLEAEHALEALLASLPEPMLPPDLAHRVLARLERDRSQPVNQSLDALLELDAVHASPVGLQARVLQGLQGEREQVRLDRLLDAVPQPEVPTGLAERILEGLEGERSPHWRERLGRRSLQLLAAAGLLFIVAVAWSSFGLENRPRFVGEELGLAPEFAVEEELLASLDVLENWDILVGEDLDLLLAEIDPVEESLLEMTEEGDDD